jgi:aryl-alcohol dehydrogenase-like predicted oxidoreductase
MKGRRNDLVIASKFGIRANWKAQLMKPLKPLVRSLKKHMQPAGQVVGVPAGKQEVSVADRFHDRIEINAFEMRASLEKSLKALQTDHLDYFFIHEPHASIIHVDEVLATAAQLKKEGKIKAFGLAYMRSQESLHIPYLDKFDILQFNNSPGIEGYGTLKQARANQPNLFFSPLKGGSRSMPAAEKLRTLHQDFPSSVILCSMFREEHIRSNCNLFN